MRCKKDSTIQQFKDFPPKWAGLHFRRRWRGFCRFAKIQGFKRVGVFHNVLFSNTAGVLWQNEFQQQIKLVI
jgi:hypothetical protein